jgi:hypothetical protein
VSYNKALKTRTSFEQKTVNENLRVFFGTEEVFHRKNRPSTFTLSLKRLGLPSFRLISIEMLGD